MTPDFNGPGEFVILINWTKGEQMVFELNYWRRCIFLVQILSFLLLQRADCIQQIFTIWARHNSMLVRYTHKQNNLPLPIPCGVYILQWHSFLEQKSLLKQWGISQIVIYKNILNKY